MAFKISDMGVSFHGESVRDGWERCLDKKSIANRGTSIALKNWGGHRHL
jgi:hypothetical protein